MTQNQFFTDLYLWIDRETAIQKGVKGYLTYEEFKAFIFSLKAKISKISLNGLPLEIEIASTLALAIQSPNKNEVMKNIKSVMSLSGGIAGIGLIIGGLGTALGWGAGLIATVSAFFFGVSWIPFIGWALGGVALTSIAAYFYFFDDTPQSQTEKAITALKSQLQKKEIEGSIFRQIKP